jgi:hexokinase
MLYAVTSAVRARSAALIAAAIVGLLDCVGEIHLKQSQTSDRTESVSNTLAIDLVVAYTGGLISKYPGWLDACQGWIDRLVADAGTRVVLKETSDGGIVGAAVLAGMMASREV